MIRPVTFVSALLALSSGAWMFVVKHQAEQIDRQIGGVTSQIRASEQRIRVLRAEWALETDPNRLSRLAALFLPNLAPMAPDQLVTWSELAARLPPVGADVPHLPFPPPLPDQLPASGAPLPMGTDLVASSTVPSTSIVLPPDAVPVPTARPSVPKGGATAPVELAATHAASLTRHRAPSVIRHVGVNTQHTARRSPPPLRPLRLGQSVLGAMHRVHPMGAQVMTINAQSVPRPVASVPSTLRPAPVRQAGPVSVFGGYAANLPPPRPAAP